MPAKRLSPFLPPLYFFILTLLYLMPLPLHWTTHVPGNEMWGDSVENLWTFWYFPHALAHQITPLFHPNLQFYPDGLDLLFKTSNLVGAWAMLPITRALGVCAGLNTWIFLQLWLGGWCMFLFVRRLGPSAVAACFAGSAYAFSPFVTAHLAGHYTLVCIAFPAGIMLTGLCLYQSMSDRKWKSAGLSLGLGLLWAALALTDFSLTIMTILLFAGLLIHLARQHGTRHVLRNGFAVHLLIGMIVSLTSIGWMIAAILKQGAGQSTNLDHVRKSAAFVTDISGLVIPPTHHWIFRIFSGEGLADSPTAHTMESGYLGLALLTIVIASLTRKGVAKAAMVWLIIGGLAFALAGGNSFTENSPFTFLQRLIGRFWPTFFPLNEFRVPARWIFVMQTAAVIVAAFGIDQLLKHYQPRRHLLIAGMFAFLAIDLFRPPMIGTSGPEPTSIPTSDEMSGTVLDLGIGFWGGNGVKVGTLNFGSLRRQMSHGRPLLSIITSRLPENQVEQRLAEPGITELLALQKLYSGIAPVQIPDLDWPAFAKRYNITTIRIPKSYKQSAACKDLGNRMLPGIEWRDNKTEIVGNATSKP